MTVSSQLPLTAYAGTGTLTQEQLAPFSWRALRPEDVVVRVKEDSDSDVTGTLLTYGDDYTATLNTSGVGGTVKFLRDGKDTPAWLVGWTSGAETGFNLKSGWTSTITRATELGQPASFSNAGQFTQKSRETALDRVSMQVQDVETELRQDAARGDLTGDGSIVVEHLADGAVTTPKLASGAVTEGKIASDAVTLSLIHI